MTLREASADPAAVERLLGELSRLRLEPHKRSWRYRLGLFGVAFFMMMLPLAFFAVVGLLAFGVGYGIFHPPGGLSPISWAGYFAVATLGPLLVFFLVKPWFSRRLERDGAVPLEPGEAPDLECFVGLLARAVGAPGPRRIELDCGVNASASFAGGWRGVRQQELKLTLGMPLIAGLDLRSFAGVLAHELGHFSQRGGMRLAWFVMLVNDWFGRLVYERDAWDVKLHAAAQSDRWDVKWFALVALALVWLARQPLWMLMMVGRAVSGYALRQMEFDADGFEIVFAGSEAFRNTSREINLLNIGSAKALRMIGEAMPDGRLPRNLPLLARAQTQGLSAKVRAAVEEEMMAETPAKFALFKGADVVEPGGGFLSTHPCDRERIEIAESHGAPGLVHCAERATSLFGDFDRSAERLTSIFYDEHFSDELGHCRLVDNSRFQGAIDDRERRFEACERFFEARFTVARPLLFPADEIDAVLECRFEPDPEAKAGPVKAWIANHREDFDLFESAEEELVSVMRATELFKAGYRIRRQAFGLPKGLAALSDRQGEATLKRDQALVRLAEFDRLARHCLLGAARSALAGSAAEGTRLVLLALRAFSAEFESILRLRRLVLAQRALLQNATAASLGRTVIERLQSNSRELAERCRLLESAFDEVRYPFDHGGGDVSIADYARSRGEVGRVVLRSYLRAEATLERLFDLYFRLVGQLCLIAEQPPEPGTGD